GEFPEPLERLPIVHTQDLFGDDLESLVACRPQHIVHEHGVPRQLEADVEVTQLTAQSHQVELPIVGNDVELLQFLDQLGPLGVQQVTRDDDDLVAIVETHTHQGTFLWV